MEAQLVNVVGKTEDTAHREAGSRVLGPGKAEVNGFLAQCRWGKSANFNSSEGDLESPSLLLGRHNRRYNILFFNTQTPRAPSTGPALAIRSFV